MSGSNPNFSNPPWVYGPKETMDWIEASYPSKKGAKKSDRESGRDFLRNLHIRLDLDVEQTPIIASNSFLRMIQKITRSYQVEEQFNLFSVADVVLRALAKAKFRNAISIRVDKVILYSHPEVSSDLRKTVDGLKEYEHIISQGKTLEMIARLDDVERCTAEVHIRKSHSQKEHAIEIFMKGKIRISLYHAFLNYLNEKLDIQDDDFIS
jgi:hypothetical protein